jgi:hypothetical protein
VKYDIPGPRGVAVSGNAAFVTSWLAPNGGPAGTVLRIVSGSSTSLAINQSEPTSIAVDSRSVYWANRGNGTIQRCAIAGCNSQPTEIASDQAMPESIALDDAAIYFCDSTNGSIVRLLK